jgi:hypothetical protein
MKDRCKLRKMEAKRYSVIDPIDLCRSKDGHMKRYSGEARIVRFCPPDGKKILSKVHPGGAAARPAKQ